LRKKKGISEERKKKGIVWPPLQGPERRHSEARDRVKSVGGRREFEKFRLEKGEKEPKFRSKKRPWQGRRRYKRERGSAGAITGKKVLWMWTNCEDGKRFCRKHGLARAAGERENREEKPSTKSPARGGEGGSTAGDKRGGEDS